MYYSIAGNKDRARSIEPVYLRPKAGETKNSKMEIFCIILIWLCMILQFTFRLSMKEGWRRDLTYALISCPLSGAWFMIWLTVSFPWRFFSMASFALGVLTAISALWVLVDGVSSFLQEFFASDAAEDLFYEYPRPLFFLHYLFGEPEEEATIIAFSH
jgi:hypothetical protein